MIALWMAYATAIAALAGVTAVALEPFARTRRVPLRWLWIAAIAASTVVTIVVALRPVQVPVETTGNGSGWPQTSATSALTTPERTAVSLTPLLLLGWSLASFCVVAGVVVALVQLARLRRRATLAELEGVPIALTQHVGPGAAPFGHPRIFVPTWATTLEQRAVHLLVLHEREHLRAGDPRWLFAAMVILALMPWNLALWWCVRRLRCAMEIDCDSRVLSIDRDVQSYGELLLLVASHRSRPRLPALLTFAESSAPLERRIRTMTDRRSLHPFRASALGAAAIVAIVVACETPRPAPVAPTKMSTATADPAAQGSASINPDTMRTASAALKAGIPASVLNGPANEPILIIYSASGEVLRATRLAGVDEGTKMPIGVMGVDAESIASVDIIKNAPWLPEEVRGGIIRVVLKPKVALPDAGDLAALTAQQKALAPNEVLRLPAMQVKARVEARPLSKEEAGALAAAGAPLVEIRDSANQLLFSKRMPSAARMTPLPTRGDDNPFAQVPAAPDDIARVEITKPPGVIRIWLKPGAKLTNAK